MISNVSGRHNRHNKLCASGSVGGARPCQGRGRGFESRLALSFNKKDIRWMSFFVKSSPAGPGRSRSTLRSGRRRADVHWTSCAVSRSGKRDTSHDVSLFFEFLRSGRCLTASTGRLASSLRSGRCLTASTGRWLLRSASVGAEQTSTGRLAPSRALLLKALAISG